MAEKGKLLAHSIGRKTLRQQEKRKLRNISPKRKRSMDFLHCAKLGETDEKQYTEGPK